VRKVFVLFLVVVMLSGALLLTGCAQRDPDVVGTWAVDFDPSLTTTFNEDGSGFHSEDLFGYGATFRWTTSGRNLNWNYPSHPQMRTRYSVSGDVFTITLDDEGGGTF